jgi:hypothetical protein
MTKIMEKHGSNLSPAMSKKSLNKENRKRELLRITMENQAILRRLQEKQSYYNVIEWEEERMQKERLIEKISEYPMHLHQNSRSPTAENGLRPRDRMQHYSSVQRSNGKKRRNLNTQQDFYKNRGGLTDTVRGTHTSSIKNKDSEIDKDIGGTVNLDADRKIFCKTSKMMSNGFYFVEVSRTDSMFYI